MTQETLDPIPKPKQPKLSVSITPELLAQVDDLVAMHKPFARRHAVHLAALKIGLLELAADPNRFVEAVGQR
jgi:hypothetical protein